jgi:hypothetical protein
MSAAANALHLGIGKYRKGVIVVHGGINVRRNLRRHEFTRAIRVDET